MAAADHLPRALESELRSGEHILWSGQPGTKATLLSHLWVALLGLLWSLFSVAGLIAVIRRGELFGSIFLLLFVGVGVYMLAYPLIQSWKAAGTLVAITNARFLLIHRHGQAIRSVDLGSIKQVERISEWGGVTLRIPTALISDGDGSQKVDYTDLHGLAEADRAYRLLSRPKI
jgi:hypothetical protein